MPSKTRRKTPRPEPTGGIATRLRESIRERGLSAYAVARDADVDCRAVARFIAGERDIRLETADSIAAALGLRLVEGSRRQAKARAAE